MISASKMAENLPGSAQNELILSNSFPCQLVKWKVSVDQKVSKGSILAVYKKISGEFANKSDIVVLPKLKSNVGGLVRRLLVDEGDHVKPGQGVLLLDVCEHKTIMKEMCAECGADLRQEPGIPGQLKEPVSASVALVHNIPELRVSQEEAEILANKDKETLLTNKKLALLVDLDQTLIHTTTENVPQDMKDVYHFQLPGQNCWYHTKFRPGWRKFLEDMSKCFELHIFTMGSRVYAHTIARMLDPTGVLFSDRIRSRDESFDMFSKYRDLRALFPCDDSMVCIIDDREDIWNCAPNLITVKPYRFFTGTGDINAPPGSEQAFTHPPAIPLHEDATEVEVKDATDGKEKGSDEKMDCEEPKNSSDNSQKSACESEKSESDASSGKEKDDDEIKDNEMESQCDETSEDGKNGETATAKKDEDKEKEDGSESPSNDAEDKNSEKENEDAISKVSEKAKDNDAVDGNHVEDHDDYLLYLEEILRRIHSSFYEVVAWNKQAEENGDDTTARVAPDLRHIVPELRRSVLKGTNLVFTGVIPTNTAHEVSQAWKIAQQFGANVSKEVLTSKNADRSKRTTHVVAARPGTEKACHALRLPSVRLVNPNWLWTCAERWEWVDERLFPVEDHKLHTNDTPNFSRQGTPKAQLERDANSKNSTKGVESDEPGLPISDDNLRIVLNPFLSFSSGEMEAMDKEVEDLMRSSDEEDDKDDGNEEILGTVSSSSNSTENGDSFQRKDQITEEDAPDGRVVNVSKRKEMNFSTIKQDRHEEEGSPSKRRKLDFVEKEEDSEGEFSSDGGSSGDDEGSDMADLLEKELFG